jgi:hypothetical protein
VSERDPTPASGTFDPPRTTSPPEIGRVGAPQASATIIIVDGTKIRAPSLVMYLPQDHVRDLRGNQVEGQSRVALRD